MIEELLDKFETNLLDMWDKTYYKDKITLDNVIDLYLNIQNEWNALVMGNSDDRVWSDGMEIIERSLGYAILYFDTDGPEQQQYEVIQGLVNIISTNQDKPSVKNALSNFRKKQISEDFKQV